MVCDDLEQGFSLIGLAVVLWALNGFPAFWRRK